MHLLPHVSVWAWSSSQTEKWPILVGSLCSHTFTHLRVSATPTSCFFLSALLWLLTTLPANVSWNYIRPRSPPFYLASSHYLFFKIQLKHDLAIYHYYITLPVLLYCSGVQSYVLFIFVYSEFWKVPDTLYAFNKHMVRGGRKERMGEKRIGGMRSS